LKELWLHYTQVTAAGVQKLQEALPDCAIYANHLERKRWSYFDLSYFS